MTLEDKLRSCEQSGVTRWAQGDWDDIPEPWLGYINLTNRCNNRCYFCAHGPAMREERGFMTEDLFHRIVAELPAGLRKVYMIKQGEPFAHPKLETYVEYLAEKRPDLHIAMHTNGIIAHKERVVRVLPHLGSLGVSVSAIDAETYRSVHQTNKFDQVLRNLEDICRIHQALPPEQRPHLFLDYVRTARNAHETDAEVLDFFGRRFPALASIDLHAMYNYQGVITEANLQVYDRVPHERFPTCVFPWSSIAFLFDGKIAYCFVEPREERFLGDITQQSFAEIWNGEEYRTFRRRMMQKEFGLLKDDRFHCHECTWLWSPHSQAPANLCGGHVGTSGERRQATPMAKLLFGGAETMLDFAADSYLAGEIHEALGCLSVLAATTTDLRHRALANRLEDLCRSVLHRYTDLSYWLTALADEGKGADDYSNRYNPRKRT